MLTRPAALAVLFAVAAPVRASDCLARLSGADPAPAAACFSSDALWADSSGAGAGPRAVADGLARLARGGGLGPVRWVRLSTGTWLAAGSVLVALDLDGGAAFWSAARVYRGARPWPPEDPSPAEPPRTARQAAETFNGTFGAGRVEDWTAQWAPDAEFVSVVGPFLGADVGVFFRNQAERYVGPHIEVLRDHGASPEGLLVMEGVLSGRCRRGGAGFEFPFLMSLRWRGGRLSRVYEAFSLLDDGCGMFWTAPR
ncbi:MAG: nuclear transport factor 2 family protein [Elusimicrobia bacterium]|nr:nuclear transport factor 2 family protein [Elusimicrobiota bacterium]